MRPLFLLFAAALCGAEAQRSAILSQSEAVPLFRKIVELMESTGIPVPGLASAARPVLDLVRKDLNNIELSSAQNSSLTYAFLKDARAYLSLADAVPKPYPFPEQARQQLAELRDSVDRVESHLRALLELKETQLRGADRDNLRRYAEANEKLGPPAPGQPRVVFLGDSITDGWRLNEYFPGRDFVNRGISGQVTGEMLGRMKADVLDLKPAAVLVLAGTNDIARGTPVRTIANNLTMIADLAEFHKIKPIFASVLPVSDYHRDVNPQYARTQQRPPGTISELNKWLRAFCQSRGFTYVDYFSALADSNGLLKAEVADDGLHPNAQGYRLMAPLALGAIERLAAPAAHANAPAKRKKRMGVF